MKRLVMFPTNLYKLLNNYRSCCRLINGVIVLALNLIAIIVENIQSQAAAMLKKGIQNGKTNVEYV